MAVKITLDLPNLKKEVNFRRNHYTKTWKSLNISN